MKRRLIKLKDDELAELMRLAPFGQELRCAFGSGGTALMVDASPWAVPILLKLRGITFEEGAGI